MIYDRLTTRYTFACPEHGDTRVALSSFRRLERLPGAAHPAVFGVRFECGCGEEHPGLVTHAELDWAPLGLGTGDSFLNLMTTRLEELEAELAELAATRIGAGEWPWSFFCYPENQPRPVFPSSFLLLAPSDRGGERLTEPRLADPGRSKHRDENTRSVFDGVVQCVVDWASNAAWR